jgi:hypothetical protein
MAMCACASASLGWTARIVQVRQHANGRSRYEVEKAMGPALVISLNEDG